MATTTERHLQFLRAVDESAVLPHAIRATRLLQEPLLAKSNPVMRIDLRQQRRSLALLSAENQHVEGKRDAKRMKIFVWCASGETTLREALYVYLGAAPEVGKVTFG